MNNIVYSCLSRHRNRGNNSVINAPYRNTSNTCSNKVVYPRLSSKVKLLRSSEMPSMHKISIYKNKTKQLIKSMQLWKEVRKSNHF